MKIVGYARVSTREQNLDRQLQALRQYVDTEMIVTDKASGKDLNRPGYQSLKFGIGKLVKGDVLYIKSLDRLSRNKEEAKGELQYFKDNGIRVKILDMPTTMMDFPEENAWVSDMVTNILIEVLASIAQNERETIRKRQREGIDAMTRDAVTGKRISQRTGRAVGRPSIEFPEKWDSVYPEWKNKKITAKKAMSILGLSKDSFYVLVKKQENQKNAPAAAKSVAKRPLHLPTSENPAQ